MLYRAMAKVGMIGIPADTEAPKEVKNQGKEKAEGQSGACSGKSYVFLSFLYGIMTSKQKAASVDFYPSFNRCAFSLPQCPHGSKISVRRFFKDPLSFLSPPPRFASRGYTVRKIGFLGYFYVIMILLYVFLSHASRQKREPSRTLPTRSPLFHTPRLRPQWFLAGTRSLKRSETHHAPARATRV